MRDPLPNGASGAQVTVVILTLDEEMHIARAIASVAGFAHRVVVVDSGSQDRTVAIARERGAMVLRRPWHGYAAQFNWALGLLPPDTHWVLRLDADEVVTPRLAGEIADRLPKLAKAVAGIVVPRRLTFQGQPIRHGGVSPSSSVRLFRHGEGATELRWMDEHLVVDGGIVAFRGPIIDDNRKSLTWWIDKHNRYASREAVDLLDREFGFRRSALPPAPRLQGPAGRRRWVKDRVYAQLPLGLRAAAYAFYRLVIRLGFLDGPRGIAFHVLQGFWYRFLVDAKIAEVKRRMRDADVDAATAVGAVLGAEVAAPSAPAAGETNSGRKPASPASTLLACHGDVDHAARQ